MGIYIMGHNSTTISVFTRKTDLVIVHFSFTYWVSTWDGSVGGVSSQVRWTGPPTEGRPGRILEEQEGGQKLGAGLLFLLCVSPCVLGLVWSE